MSREQFVKNVQTFREQVAQYVKAAGPLTRNELESAIARLADATEKEASEQSALDKKFKTLLLKPLYSSRLRGRTPSGFSRFHLDPAQRISGLVNCRFLYPVSLCDSSIAEWAAATPETWRRLLFETQEPAFKPPQTAEPQNRPDGLPPAGSRMGRFYFTPSEVWLVVPLAICIGLVLLVSVISLLLSR